MLKGFYKLQEEMGELNQVLGKIGQAKSFDHWQGNLQDNLHEELGDVLASIRYMIEANGLNYQFVADRASDKYRLFNSDDWTMRGIDE